jgi:hypothetical protein
MKDYIILLGGALCILILLYSIIIKSRDEGFTDDFLMDGDRGSDAWFEKGTRGDHRKLGTRTGSSVTPPPDRKEVKGQGSGGSGRSGGSRTGSGSGTVSESESGRATGRGTGSESSKQAVKQGGGQAAPPIKNTMNIGNISQAPSTRPGDAGEEQHDITLDYKPPTAGVAEDAAPAKLSKKPPIEKPVVANVNDRINEDICRNVMHCVPVKKQTTNLDQGECKKILQCSSIQTI